MIEVIQPGIFTTLQDFGRGGNESSGVPPSGAFDPFLASIANRLVGNAPSLPVLEFALIGPTLRIQRETAFAIAGYSCKYLLNGAQAPEFQGFHARAGSELMFGSMKGWFGYLAIAGGFQGEMVLGSASTYLQGRIGKRLEKGVILQHGESKASLCSLEVERFHFDSSQIVPVASALHTSDFATLERDKLVNGKYKITNQSNRMGIRLSGEVIHPPEVRRSAPVLSGTIQIPSGGQAILLGPDGPTTGGYAQLAVIPRIAWTILAGKQPGSEIAFHWIDRSKAVELYEHRAALYEEESSWSRV